MKAIKKSYIVPESAAMQVLEAMCPIMKLSGATGGAGDNQGTEDEVNSQLGLAPGRKPF